MSFITHCNPSEAIPLPLVVQPEHYRLALVPSSAFLNFQPPIYRISIPSTPVRLSQIVPNRTDPCPCWPIGYAQHNHGVHIRHPSIPSMHTARYGVGRRITTAPHWDAAANVDITMLLETEGRRPPGGTAHLPA